MQTTLDLTRNGFRVRLTPSDGQRVRLETLDGDGNAVTFIFTRPELREWMALIEDQGGDLGW